MGLCEPRTDTQHRAVRLVEPRAEHASRAGSSAAKALGKQCWVMTCTCKDLVWFLLGEVVVQPACNTLLRADGSLWSWSATAERDDDACCTHLATCRNSLCRSAAVSVPRSHLLSSYDARRSLTAAQGGWGLHAGGGFPLSVRRSRCRCARLAEQARSEVGRHGTDIRDVHRQLIDLQPAPTQAAEPTCMMLRQGWRFSDWSRERYRSVQYTDHRMLCAPDSFADRCHHRPASAGCIHVPCVRDDRPAPQRVPPCVTPLCRSRATTPLARRPRTASFVSKRTPARAIAAACWEQASRRCFVFMACDSARGPQPQVRDLCVLCQSKQHAGVCMSSNARSKMG